MEIISQDIILRDFKKSDIDDEIRWMNIDTAWMEMDRPWEYFDPVDENELRRKWMYNIHNLTPEAVRCRLEIEVDGKHIGFVSAYNVDENYERIPFDETEQCRRVFRALEIEICEPDYWCCGFGKQALNAYMDYFANVVWQPSYVKMR